MRLALPSQPAKAVEIAATMSAEKALLPAGGTESGEYKKAMEIWKAHVGNSESGLKFTMEL